MCRIKELSIKTVFLVFGRAWYTCYLSRFYNYGYSWQLGTVVEFHSISIINACWPSYMHVLIALDPYVNIDVCVSYVTIYKEIH